MSRIRVEPFTDEPEGIRAITDYWAQNDDLTFTHKVGATAAALGIRERDVVRLVTQFSRAYVPDWPCGACGGIRPLASRAEYTRARLDRLAWYCRGCLERFAAEADAARRTEVEKHYPGTASPSHPPGLVDRVFLLALARIGRSASDGSVGPLAEANPPLSPTAYEDDQILARLHERSGNVTGATEAWRRTVANEPQRIDLRSSFASALEPFHDGLLLRPEPQADAPSSLVLAPGLFTVPGLVTVRGPDGDQRVRLEEILDEGRQHLRIRFSEAGFR